MSKHTPGPWSVTYSAKGPSEIRGDANTTDYVAFFDTNFRVDSNNARLIAAAPELLEALKNLTVAVDFHRGMNVPNMTSMRAKEIIWENAIMTIAKAEGK